MVCQFTLIQLLQRFRWHQKLQKKTLKLIGSMFVLLSVSSQSANESIVLPELGDNSSGLMSAKDEKALGQSWLKSFRGRVMLESDPIILNT